MTAMRILVVDDDYDVRISIQTVLEIEGYEVLGASNGAEALALLRSNGVLPGLIILDLMMPVMNGYDFVQAARADELFQEIPILVASAGMMKAPLIGVQGFLPKPVQLESLLEACRATIASQASAVKTE